MSQENVALIQRLIDGWNRGERSFPDDEIDPDVVIESRFRPEPYAGLEGLAQWMREIDEQFEEWRIALDEWRTTGDRVVALGRLHVRGRTGGVELEQPAAALVEISNGRLLRLRFFAGHADALEAAGLRE